MPAAQIQPESSAFALGGLGEGLKESGVTALWNAGTVVVYLQHRRVSAPFDS